MREELIDRFGDYPEEVASLFQVSSLKIYSKREKIESISEKKQKIEVLMEEKESQQIDGAKLFQFANKYGRFVQLGTENMKLKIGFQWDRDNFIRRYEILEEFIQGLTGMKRD